MKRIIWNHPETGIVSVTTPAYNDRLRPSGDTDDALIQRVIEKSLPLGVTYHIVDDDDVSFGIPITDRTFRNAWVCDHENHKVKVDMPIARGIQMDCIRKVRNAELAKLDMPFMRAVETGDTAEQQRIAVQKQTLRDIPQTFDLTTPNDTPEELKAMWPTEL